MAFPKKKSRKIRVKNHDYLWIAKGDDKYINLSIISEELNAQKLFGKYPYNTKDKNASWIVNPFIITPYVVRETIIYGLKLGYSPERKGKDMDLGDLSQKINLNLSGERKTKKLISIIEKLSQKDNSSLELKANLQLIVKETRKLVKYGEWYIGFEIMLSNLDEIDTKIENDTLILIKEIFESASINWRDDWAWIENLKNGVQ